VPTIAPAAPAPALPRAKHLHRSTVRTVGAGATPPAPTSRARSTVRREASPLVARILREGLDADGVLLADVAAALDLAPTLVSRMLGDNADRPINAGHLWVLVRRLPAARRAVSRALAAICEVP